MRTPHLATRGITFTLKFFLSTVLMLAVGIAQAPALFWYVLSATPECGSPATAQQMTLALWGIGAVAVASVATAIVLAVRFMELRWGWFIWWIVPVLAVAAPVVAWKYLPTLSPGVGGFLCL